MASSRLWGMLGVYDVMRIHIISVYKLSFLLSLLLNSKVCFYESTCLYLSVHDQCKMVQHIVK